MKIKNLTPEDIEKMNYTDFVSLIKEENRPPGGKMTIREILKNSFLNSQSKVLEVGCTNGFTSLEIARLINCKVVGLDINKNSLDNARERVKNENVEFLFGDACKIPFDKEFFDLVICGNATSFMNDKGKAIKEYERVVKDWGFIALTPMYYLQTPPEKIVSNVAEIIGTPINVKTKDEWLNLFRKLNLEIYYVKDYKFIEKSQNEIKEYVEEMLDKEELKEYFPAVKQKIKDRWLKTMEIFNENLKYVGYSIVLLRKRGEEEEIELFDSVENK